MKKPRQEVIDCPPASGLMGIMDAHFMPIWNLTTDELDILGDEATDEELGFMMDETLTSFADRRKKLNIRNKYVPYYQEKYGSSK